MGAKNRGSIDLLFSISGGLLRRKRGLDFGLKMGVGVKKKSKNGKKRRKNEQKVTKSGKIEQKAKK